MRLLRKIKKLVKGELSVAIDEGMIVEDGVSVMANTHFGSEPYLITLRKGCRVSSNVTFITHDGGTWAFRNYEPYMAQYADVVKFGSIEIGEGAFIGANSTIMPGVRIGHNSVVGVGSVVTKSIPPETVWAGVPARQICTLEEYAKKSKQQMPKLFDKQSYQDDKKEYLIKLMRNGEI